MPMSRYQIRNEYSLADPELYGAADKDDPEALLEGVAMAGLVGVLRQLGDLAEFAAEIFHDLHEEVMATSTRGHGLMVRVKQLEAEFPLVEKTFLSQRSPSAFFSNAGTDWHPSLHTNQTLITGGDLPRFIMDSYEECRGPPRLFLLDKFDVAGAGASLKRYTDPSFFKVEASSYGQSSAEVQKERRSRKSKKKSSRWRNDGTPDFLPASHAKLHQLFLEERVENGVSDPARLVKLKRRLNGFPYSKTGKSFMDKFINASSPEDKVVHEIAYGSSPLELPYEAASKSGTRLPQTDAVSSLKESISVEKTVQTPSINEVCKDLSYRELSSGTRQYPLEMVHEKEIAVDGESKPDGYQSDDVASEVDNYMDALATMESEIEIDTEFRMKYDTGIVDLEKLGTDCYPHEELPEVKYSDSHSTGNSNPSDDGNNSFKKGSSSFSYSDTGSTSAENMTVDVQVVAEELPSTQDCEAEVGVLSIEKGFTSEELPVAQPHQSPELDVSSDTSNDVCEIPNSGSESREPSSSFCISDLAPRPPRHSPPDGGEVLATGTLRGPQTLANHEEVDTKFIMAAENNKKRGTNIPWNSRRSNIHSKRKDDEPPIDTASAANRNLHKLDDIPGDLSSASIQISKIISEVIPEKCDSESSMNDLLKAENEKDICTEDNSQISSAHSVILHAEDEPSVPAYMDFETTNMVLQLEVVDSVDNVSGSAKEITVKTDFASESSNNSSIAEQQGAQCTDDGPRSIFSAVDTCHEEKISKGVIPEADGGDMGEITGSKTTASNNFTDHLNSSGCSSLAEFPIPSRVDDIDVDENSSSLNFVEGETAELQSPLFSLISTGPTSVTDEKDTKVRHDSDADKVDYSSEGNLPAEYRRPTQESDKYGYEVYDNFLPKYVDESDKQSEEAYQETALPDLDTVQYETAFCDHSNSEMIDQVSESSLAAGSSLKPEHSNIHEHPDDSLPSSSHHFPELRTHIEQKFTLQADQLDSDHQHVEELIPKNLSRPQQLSCSDHLDEGSADGHSESCLGASKPVVQVNVQDDSLAVESLYGDQTSFGLSIKSDSDYLDHVEDSNTSSISSSVLPAREAIKLELSPPGKNEVYISEQGRDQLTEVSLGSPLLPEVPQIDLPEMPPLPPLPPVQWRIGRTQQHASGMDSGQNTYGLVQPIFPFKTDSASQMGYPTFNRDGLLPPAPVLPMSALKNEDHQHVSEHEVSNMTYGSPLSMQVPVTSKDTNRQDDFLTSDSISVNPFLTLSSTYNESPSHGISAEEAGSIQPSLAPFSAVTTNGDATYASESVPSQYLNQMPPEVHLEPKGSSVSAEIRVIKFLDAHSPQPMVQDEQPIDGPTNSVGEKVWSTSNSFSPAIEDGTLNGNRHMKLLRPRTPLIDAVAAHDKNMLRKVKDRAQPEVQKVEERDTLLEQIRAKSFSLKPAVVTRPSIQGPQNKSKSCSHFGESKCYSPGIGW